MTHWLVWNRDKILYSLVILGALALVVVLFWGMAQSNADAQREQEKQDQFEGACLALDATAQGDVCVKGDRVVLTRKEFESK